ncbi:hypothetical protein VNI00_006928 [Paramarasmius palmivorus]|uniref:Nephrocystin 3-like N-terminal domain-containing protein n=1 Tax=Paramarasmius palmivorus TaxID=297713 RepID=A0AAW0D5A3_9AGAR
MSMHMFAGMDSDTISVQGARFFNITGDQHIRYGNTDVLDTLREVIGNVGASYNSSNRHPPPRCDPGSREDVLSIIRQSIDSPTSEDRLVWLHGPPGIGKTAIAQTFAENGAKEGYLATSFFFSRDDPTRNTSRPIFLHIAYGLATSIPYLRSAIRQAIQNNGHIVYASLEEQFQKLILEPCQFLSQFKWNFPWIVVIDGLDECTDSVERQRILNIILNACVHSDIRLRFLVCGRLEQDIGEVLNTDAFSPFVARISLGNYSITTSDQAGQDSSTAQAQ